MFWLFWLLGCLVSTCVWVYVLVFAAVGLFVVWFLVGCWLLLLSCLRFRFWLLLLICRWVLCLGWFLWLLVVWLVYMVRFSLLFVVIVDLVGFACDFVYMCLIALGWFDCCMFCVA